MMDRRSLRYFIAVHEAGSFSAASLKLNISQSALIKSVGLLEESVGCKLFDRLPRGVALNEAGGALLSHAQTIASDFEQAERAMREAYHGETPRIVIGAGPSWERRILPTAVANLLARQPNLKLEIVSGSKLQMLARVREGEIDLLFTSMSPDTEAPGLTFEPLTFDSLVICARAGHFLATRSPASLDDLDGYGWILPGHSQNSRQLIDSLYITLGRAPPERVVEGASATMNLNIVRQSDLLSVVTSRTFDVENRGDLAEIYFAQFAATRRAGISYRTGAVHTPAVLALMEEMRRLTRIDGRN